MGQDYVVAPGNPSGRPKRAANFADDLMAKLAEVIQVTERGKVKRITKQRVLIEALTAGGIEGDRRAANLLISWCGPSGQDPHRRAGSGRLGADRGEPGGGRRKVASLDRLAVV